MIFWIGFTIMFLNEGFVMMRHVSPLFARLRTKVIKKLGENVWYRLHGTLDYTWIGLVTLGLIVNSNRLLHISVLSKTTLESGHSQIISIPVKFSKILSVSQFVKKTIHTINKTYLKVDFIINFIIHYYYILRKIYN